MTMHRVLVRSALALALISVDCAPARVQPSVGGDNLLTFAQERAGWRLLFDAP